MIDLSFAVDGGYMLSLLDLLLMLGEMNHEDVIWSATALPHVVSHDGQTHEYIMIGYSNPDAKGVLNPLAFKFPAVKFGCIPGAVIRPDNLIVVLHPDYMEPIGHGLYTENGRVMYDALEDRESFWPPLEKALKQAPSARYLDTYALAGIGS